MDDRTTILNLIYTYSRYVDEGDFTSVGKLFERGQYEIPSMGKVLPGTAVGRFFEEHLRRYEDGTPKTNHVNPNVIVTTSESVATATAWTSVLVFQLIEDRIECIFSGWYDDDFERVEGEWVWRRRVAHRRFNGDTSHHAVHLAPGT